MAASACPAQSIAVNRAVSEVVSPFCTGMHGTNLQRIVLRCCVCRNWVAFRDDPDDLNRHGDGAMRRVSAPFHTSWVVPLQVNNLADPESGSALSSDEDRSCSVLAKFRGLRTLDCNRKDGFGQSSRTPFTPLVLSAIAGAEIAAFSAYTSVDGGRCSGWSAEVLNCKGTK